MFAPPIVRGRRRIDITVGVPDGCVRL